MELNEPLFKYSTRFDYAERFSTRTQRILKKAQEQGGQNSDELRVVSNILRDRYPTSSFDRLTPENLEELEEHLQREKSSINSSHATDFRPKKKRISKEEFKLKKANSRTQYKNDLDEFFGKVEEAK
jgi:hypothetical protein